MRFSIVVPIYNAERYLRQCVDSIINQAYTDFEVVLVDDGSPDNCGKICDEYASKYDNVKVVHKPNGGLVSARKAGISVAEGDYVFNVDSDDWIKPGSLAKASEIIDSHNPDIVVFAIDYVTGDKIETKSEIVRSGLYDRAQIESEIIPNMLCTPDFSHMYYYICGKFYRRTFVLPKQLAVDERISMGEDVSVSMLSYLDANSVYISSEPIYECRVHEGSMSRSFKPKQYKDIELGIGILKDNSQNAPAVFADEIERYCAYMCFVLLSIAALEGAKDKIDDIKKLWCDTFIHAFNVSKFENITIKSKIAVYLLKKRKIGMAYSFLRLCALLKGAK